MSAVDVNPGERYAIEHVGPRELAILRLVAHGESVIDWKRLYFRTREEVDDFLRLNLFDPGDPADMRRLRAILRQAVDYLRKTFRYRVAAPVAEPRHIQDLFLLASGVQEPHRLRRIACVALKVMHTVHHIEARELLFMARMSEVELSQMVDHRVTEVLTKLAASLPIIGFEGNTKSRESIITKLISKRENLAAQVYDRHRYRIIVRDRSALVTTLLALAHDLFPFNYVLPGQTQNTLLTMGEIATLAPNLRAGLRELETESEPTPTDLNEFSGRSYRILNFIVDLPIRIDATVMATRHEGDADLGRIVFAPLELQIVDEATRQRNESGENAHVRYKRRQLRKVLARLSRGLVVPRGSKGRATSKGSLEN
jgi:uncharacterized protein (TIGR04552 family)